MDVDAIMAIEEILKEEEAEAVARLSDALGVPADRCPTLTRLIEDIGAVRRYRSFVAQGESRRHSMVRTAKEMGFPMETIRYRIRCLEEWREDT